MPAVGGVEDSGGRRRYRTLGRQRIGGVDRRGGGGSALREPRTPGRDREADSCQHAKAVHHGFFSASHGSESSGSNGSVAREHLMAGFLIGERTANSSHRIPIQ